MSISCNYIYNSCFSNFNNVQGTFSSIFNFKVRALWIDMSSVGWNNQGGGGGVFVQFHVINGIWGMVAIKLVKTADGGWQGLEIGCWFCAFLHVSNYWELICKKSNRRQLYTKASQCMYGCVFVAFVLGNRWANLAFFFC